MADRPYSRRALDSLPADRYNGHIGSPRMRGREERLANTKSAKKRIRQNSRRQVRNARIRTRARSSVRSARQTVDSSDRNAGEVAVKSAIQELDRAASKGVLHR